MQSEEEKREKKRIRQKLWRLKTKEERRQKAKIYRHNNREKLLEQSKKRYQKNKEKNREYAKKYINNNRAKIRKLFNSFMKDKVCNRCNFNDPRALVWHHIDPRTKSNTIGQMVGTGVKWERILLEIKKCECLCANCHTIHHSHQSSP